MSALANGDDSHHSPYGPYGPTFQIIPGVQSYDWGKLASQGSAVATFAEATKELEFEKKDDQPYAELWMGTHPTLPSRILPPSSSASASSEYVTLSTYLADHPALIGEKVQARFFPSEPQANGHASNGTSSSKADIPFLFKVLSIGKALSIQAHPDKKLAKKLHAEKPKMYKDDNHKPEMAIALTDFKGFCGFRPIAEIAKYLHCVPEFKDVVQPNDKLLSDIESLTSQDSSRDEEKKKLLRQIFALLMEADTSRVEKNVKAITSRYEASLGTSAKPSDLEVEEKLARLVCTLNKQYPNDVGVFCSFVLNVMEIQKGESMFLMANEPHAYLEGDIIECMAASDNVVRAGLTPKARDVKVLIDMLTYTDEPSQNKLMKAKAFLPDNNSENASAYQDGKNGPTLLYDPPIDEFSVLMTSLKKGDAAETQRALQGPSMLIVTSGTGTLTSLPPSNANAEEREFTLSTPGQVFFVGAETKIKLQATSTEDLVIFRAFVEVQ